MSDWKMTPSPGALAYIVGEALRANGITVHQTKEKFGTIRVYVSPPNTHAARAAYREVYLNASWACPALAEALLGSADYSEWLFETEAALDAFIAERVARGAGGFLEAWNPRFELARALIRGEDTTRFNTTTEEE